MMVQSAPGLIEVLRSTLERLERSPEVKYDDSAFRELKSSILRAIAELEVKKSAAA
jgi:hypothetical protein